MADAVATACAGDSPESNLTVAERWTNDVWNRKSLDVLDEIAYPAVVHHGAAFPDAHGVEAIKAALERQFTAFPDITLGIDAAFADGDIVVVRWAGTGTNDGEFLGVAPSGKETTFTGINVYRLTCGKIIESWSEMNGLDVLRQVQGADTGVSATPSA